MDLPRPHQIFIVEDHPVMRKSYLMLFDTVADMEVCGVAADAESALEQIPELVPELVVVDISLPGMSGLELVASLRAKHPDLHLVVITGHDESRYAAASFRAGADGFVRKGDTEAILRLLRQILAPA